jgi:cytochrome c oxidase subunit 3/cytochrome o ubiquinol oxidase subunit 3
LTSAAPGPILEWRLPDRGRVGVLCMIAAEASLFTIFVIAYLYYIGKSLTGPYPRQVLDVPVLATACLLSSSISVIFAEFHLKRGRALRFKLWLALTALLGAVFLFETAREWGRLIFREHLTIATNLCGTTYYSLVGLHASHVTVGLTLLVLVLIISFRSDVMLGQARRFELLSWYWHFVDCVWIVVFTVVYVIGR